MRSAAPTSLSAPSAARCKSLSRGNCTPAARPATLPRITLLYTLPHAVPAASPAEQPVITQFDTTASVAGYMLIPPPFWS